jgi:hypothetical protein
MIKMNIVIAGALLCASLSLFAGKESCLDRVKKESDPFSGVITISVERELARREAQRISKLGHKASVSPVMQRRRFVVCASCSTEEESKPLGDE